MTPPPLSQPHTSHHVMRCGTHPAANGHFSAESLALFYSALGKGRLVPSRILEGALASRRREDTLTKIARAATGVEIGMVGDGPSRLRIAITSSHQADIGFGGGWQIFPKGDRFVGVGHFGAWGGGGGGLASC